MAPPPNDWSEQQGEQVELLVADGAERSRHPADVIEPDPANELLRRPVAGADFQDLQPRVDVAQHLAGIGLRWNEKIVRARVLQQAARMLPVFPVEVPPDIVRELLVLEPVPCRGLHQDALETADALRPG